MKTAALAGTLVALGATVAVAAVLIARDGGADTPPAADVLRRSDEAMNRLTSVRVMTSESGGPPGVSDYAAPNRGWFHAVSGARPACIVGDKMWRMAVNGKWFVEPWQGDAPFAWPSFHRAVLEDATQRPGSPWGWRSAARNLTIEDGGKLAGESVWRVRYEYTSPGIEGAVEHAVSETISQRTYLLLESVTTGSMPAQSFGRSTQTYSRFNEPILGGCGVEDVASNSLNVPGAML